MANTYTKNYQDGAALTESHLDTAYTSFQLGLDKTTVLTAGTTDGHVLTSTGAGLPATFEAIPDPTTLARIQNLSLTANAAVGALTVAVKTQAGSDATSADPIKICFNNAGTTSGDLSELTITSALSITVPSSASLGLISTSSTFVYVYARKNSTAIPALAVAARGDLDQRLSAITAISATADNSTVVYGNAASAVNNSLRLIGRISAAKTSANAWQTPTRTEVVGGFVERRSVKQGEASSAAVGDLAISDSSGTFTNTTGTPTDVTNLSVTIATSGRPVKLELIGTTSQSSIALLSATIDATGEVRFLRGTSTISLNFIGGTVDPDSGGITTLNLKYPPQSFGHIDIQPAGTYTYKVQANRSAASVNITVVNCKLIAYEL